jgi:multisubunit Na+/H+ antiporter MnhE subunit
MSRKWERMVRKNTKTVNKARKKQGIPPVSADKLDVFKGRSIVLSLFLVAVCVFLIFTTKQTEQTALSWTTTFSYLLLALFVYYVRRPYLKVNKGSLIKRGFARERYIFAENIKQITITPGYVFIDHTGKQKWVYSKFLNRFDVAAMADRLKRFAEQNQITFVDERVAADQK